MNAQMTFQALKRRLRVSGDVKRIDDRSRFTPILAKATSPKGKVRYLPTPFVVTDAGVHDVAGAKVIKVRCTVLSSYTTTSSPCCRPQGKF